MPTKPWSEIRKNLTPEQRARSDEKANDLRIGYFVHQLREEQGLTQTELADKIGITQQQISKIEWGDEIQLSTLSKVLAALNTELYAHTPTDQISLTHVN